MSVADWVGWMDWGDVPTWVGGVGALAAGWFAYQTIKSQRQQIGEQRAFIAEQSQFMDEQRQNLELERAELRAAAEDRRTAQAHAVRLSYYEAGSGTDDEGNPTDPDHWLVVVSNGSDSPVHDAGKRIRERATQGPPGPHDPRSHPSAWKATP